MPEWKDKLTRVNAEIQRLRNVGVIHDSQELDSDHPSAEHAMDDQKGTTKPGLFLEPVAE